MAFRHQPYRASIEDGAAKKKGGTIVRTHGHCIKVFEKAIDNSPWETFEGDTEEGQAGQGD